MDTYNPHAIESKWQQVWDAEGAFEVQNPEPGAPRNPLKRYVLEMLPYPSGSLHMGHMLVYTLGDVRTHFYRRNGFEVLRPMGFDSFGLPAENAAINDGGHPREIVERNIDAIRRTMKTIGWAIDWPREFSTHEPEYYRWTQWLFLQLYAAGLADRRTAPVKWCPHDQTVLANEQVRDGRCERCGALVESRNIAQWFFKTTRYADQLLDFSALRWPERVVAAQRHWIGRSEGAEVLFELDELRGDDPGLHDAARTRSSEPRSSCSRPSTHSSSASSPSAARGRRSCASTCGSRRRSAGKSAPPAARRPASTPASYALNPVNDERIPVFVADYVLMDYGTGAIMAVPAHDERDFEFARTFGLHDPAGRRAARAARLRRSGDRRTSPIPTTRCSSTRGRSPASSSPEAKAAIVEWLGEAGRGKPSVNYRLRDWGFSRQRYWGCPIPIIHCAALGVVPVPDEDLPVLLPEVDDYRPKGEAPLAADEEWMATSRARSAAARHGASPTRWTRSSTPRGTSCATATRTTTRRRSTGRSSTTGCPVDFYSGGVDHATMHMIYARFFQKALARSRARRLPRAVRAASTATAGLQLGGTKMSKSKGNVIGPDEFVERVRRRPGPALHPVHRAGRPGHGVAPTPGVEGMLRFVRRLWRIVNEVAETASRSATGRRRSAGRPTRRSRSVTDDIGRRESFNTAISAVMELVNELSAEPDAARRALRRRDGGVADPAVRAARRRGALVAPRAERLWEEPWPVADESLLRRETVELVLQVNGKVRDRVAVAGGPARGGADRDREGLGAR